MTKRTFFIFKFFLILFFLGTAFWVEASGTYPRQDGYRWRNDDGTDSTATWAANENTPLVGLNKDTNIRLRYNVGLRSYSIQSYLYYKIDGSAGTYWARIPDTVTDGIAFHIGTTGNFTNGQATTQKLTSTVSASFITGSLFQNPRGVNQKDTTGYQMTEYEGVIVANNNATYGTKYLIQGMSSLSSDFPSGYIAAEVTMASRIQGTLYDAISGGNPVASKAIKASVNGGATKYTGTTDVNGNFSLIITEALSSGQVIAVWVDEDATVKATTVTKITGGFDLASFNLYQNYLTIRDEGSVGITNQDLDTAHDGDTDIVYSNGGTTTLTTNYSININSGDAYIPGGNTNLAGNWLNSGTFTAGSGTVTLTGTSQAISGTNSFNNLVINSPNTITFESGVTQTIGSTFSCTGSTGNIITINSSISGNSATLSKSSGTVSCDYISVKDSTATGGAVWNPGIHSTSVSGNSGWLFNTAPTLTNVSDSPDPIKGEDQITITPSGQGDGESDALYYYCNESGTPTSANTLCSQGNASYSSPYSSMTCTYNVSSGNTTRTIYCRAYDGTDYSTERTTTYVVDTTFPTTSDDYGAKDNQWQIGNQTITLTPTDIGGAGLAWTKYCTSSSSCDPSTGTAYTVPVVISTQGVSYFRYASADNAGNIQTTVSKTVKINVAPSFTSDPFDSSSGIIPTNTGSDVVFTATASDSVDQYYLAICKTNSIAAVNGGAPTCPGGNWCISSATNSGTGATCNYSAQIADTESDEWFAFVCDNNSASLCSASSQGSGDNGSPFKVNHKPSYTNLVAYPSSLTVGSQVTFSATALDTDSDTSQDTVTLYVCKSNDFTGTECGIGGEWCHSLASASNPNCNHMTTSQDMASLNYYGYVFDSHNFAITNPIFSSISINEPGGRAKSSITYTNTPTQPVESSRQPIEVTPSPVPSESQPVEPQSEKPSGIVEKISSGFEKLLGPNLPEPEPNIELPPAETIVLENPPLSMSGKVYLLPEKKVNKFAFDPLPSDLLVLTNKLPKLKLTLNKLNINTLSDVANLKNYNITVPGLKETINLPSSSKLQVAQLTEEEKDKIPTGVVFSRVGLKNIDVLGKIDISNEGAVNQKINIIANKKLSLTVKPEYLAKEVRGYVIFKSRDISKKEKVNNLASVGEIFSATVSNLPPFKISVDRTDQKTVDQLITQEFGYRDENNDGIFTAEIDSPVSEGSYDIMTVINYKDVEINDEVMHLLTIVDPEGYVYEKAGNREIRINNAKASLYWFNDKKNTFELWAAKDYGQDNPQITDSTGKYSFLVPEGKYYLKVDAPGYFNYQSDIIDVKEGQGVHMNIELKVSNSFLDQFMDWKFTIIVLLFLTNLIVLIGIFRKYKVK